MSKRSVLRFKRLWLGLLLSLIASWTCLHSAQYPLVMGIDRLLSDQWLRWKAVEHDPRVVIVDIDERSLAEQGRWPWSRTKIVRLIEELAGKAGAKVVAFDLLFAEAEENADLQLIDAMLADPQFANNSDALKQLRLERDADAKLARTLQNHPVVLGFYFTADRDGHKSGQLPPPLMQSEALAAQGWRLLSWDGYGANLKQFIEVAEGGFYSPRIDTDGLVRELPLLGDHGGQAYESLVSAVLRRYLNSPIAQFTDKGLVYRTANQSVLVPLTPEMTTIIPFAGKGGPRSGRFEYIGASDVLSGKLSANQLAGKIVLVGTTALGLTDLRATPVSPSYPGVETHASVLSGALSGQLVTRPELGNPMMAVMTLLLGLAVTLVLLQRGAIGVLIVSAGALFTVIGFHALAAQWMYWSLSVGSLILLIAALCFGNLVAGFFVEGRAKRAVVERFGEYVSPALVAKMTEDPDAHQMRSENKEVTILFADIRGFTPIAESLSPQDLREYLNLFLGTMSNVVHRHNGTVDKFIGDSVMAFWGAPLDDPEHARNAVTAAQVMLLETQRLNQELTRRGWPHLEIGIGINTGVVRVGDMGTEQRRTYTVIGDAVNTAARLESLTKRLGIPFACGPRTQQMILQRSPDFCPTLVFAGSHVVPGKAEPIEVYTLSSLMSEPFNAKQIRNGPFSTVPSSPVNSEVIS